MNPIERAYATETFKWDRLSQSERLVLIEKWENEDAYPYGRANAKRTFRKLGHYLQKRALDLETDPICSHENTYIVVRHTSGESIRKCSNCNKIV
jgi:hypothetical protein